MAGLNAEQLAELHAAYEGAVYFYPATAHVTWRAILDHIDEQASHIDALVRVQSDLTRTVACQHHDLRAALSQLLDAQEHVRTLQQQRVHARQWANFWQQNWGDMQDDPDLEEMASDGWKVGDPLP